MDVAVAVFTITGLALIAGIGLAIARKKLPAGESTVAEQVDGLLPQTQCAQCGYPGCRPYAEAIASGEAPINLCPPGGEATVRRIAALLGREAPPLVGDLAARSVAVIDEDKCIGCMHCRNACPVDAIIGTHHMMHSVLREECTGCELCIEPCPVDCIDLVPVP